MKQSYNPNIVIMLHILVFNSAGLVSLINKIYFQITEKGIRQVDKSSLFLASNLSVQKAMYVNISAESTVEEDVYMKIDDNRFDIPNTFDNDIFNDNDFDWPSDEENHKNKIKNEMVEVSVSVKKEKEDKTDDVCMLSRFLFTLMYAIKLRDYILLDFSLHND